MRNITHFDIYTELWGDYIGNVPAADLPAQIDRLFLHWLELNKHHGLKYPWELVEGDQYTFDMFKSELEISPTRSLPTDPLNTLINSIAPTAIDAIDPPTNRF